MKVCTFWLTCPCPCHERITKMFLMAEAPRQVMYNPDYRAPEQKFWMPSLEEITAYRLSQATADRKVEIIKSENELIPDLAKRKFEPTESGRTARGQLEQLVQEACDDWLLNKVESECSTKWVSAWIMEHHRVDASRGAIDAVWKRWVSLSFCITFKNPTQFVAYTPDGIRLGLDAMKERARRTQHRKDQNMKLGRR